MLCAFSLWQIRGWLAKVTIELTHSHLEESEDRLEMKITGGASSSSDAARALGANAGSLFSGSSMQPGVPMVPHDSNPGKGAKGGRGKGEGKGKGAGKSGKKEPEPCLADI